MPFLKGNRLGLKHGHNKRGKKTPEYQTWADMIQRCENPNDTSYKDYGGRGIKVCERWHDFCNFFEDVGVKPGDLTLDRIDNDGNYEPGNWWWATKKRTNKKSARSKKSILVLRVWTLWRNNYQKQSV